VAKNSNLFSLLYYHKLLTIRDNHFMWSHQQGIHARQSSCARWIMFQLIVHGPGLLAWNILKKTLASLQLLRVKNTCCHF